MDSHTFSEPRLVSDDADPLTWQVDLLRRGVVVDTLAIHANNLPPRKRKNKVVWKLPDSGETLPRFGSHEKERLWELFKEQKKLRRKRAKETTGRGGDGGEEEQEGEEEEEDETGQDVHLSGQQAQAKVVVVVVDDPGSTTTTAESGDDESPPPPRPPPGFGIENLSIQKEATTNSAAIESPGLDDNNTSLQPETTSTNGLPALTPRYFWAPPQQSLGAVICTTFVHCMTLGHAQEWLAYYSPNHYTIVSTLLFGQAQAVSRTPLERLRQWQSLAGPWTCQGWTCQDNVAVMTGQTRQPAGPLSFSLTLILNATENEGYQIVQDVLCLFAANG